MHQNSSKRNQWVNIQDKLLFNQTEIQETWRWFAKKKGENKHTCPIFDNYFLASSNQIKLKSTDYIFSIKQDDICDYNPLCFMSSGMMLDDIIMDIFTQSTKETTEAHQEHLFSISKDDAIQLYKGSMQDFTWKTTIDD